MAKKKPELEYAIVCDDIRQETGNKISVMGVYMSDKLATQGVPFRLAKLSFLQKWMNGDGEFRIKAVLSSPTGEIGRIQFPNFKIPGLKQKSYLMAFFQSVTIQETGDYQLQVFFDEEEEPHIVFRFAVETQQKP